MFKRYFLYFLSAFLVIIYFAYRKYRSEQSKIEISKLHYGVKANDLRRKLQIPIIEDNMTASSEVKQGLHHNSWLSKEDMPTSNEILHAWKKVNALSTTVGLNAESDAFRKKINDTLCYQLNIYSKISGDSAVVKKGSLFYYPNIKNPIKLDIELDGRGVDSVSKSWGLHY